MHFIIIYWIVCAVDRGRDERGDVAGSPIATVATPFQLEQRVFRFEIPPAKCENPTNIVRDDDDVIVYIDSINRKQTFLQCIRHPWADGKTNDAHIK